ncbi:MAG: SUMF1/EgtB/PvdO family nonheme iron enzyme [Treponema sp.]|nr:SUMF1/EgtB/PvdO family nonheme iron enzyme [Treponema sp.]
MKKRKSRETKTTIIIFLLAILCLFFSCKNAWMTAILPGLDKESEETQDIKAPKITTASLPSGLVGELYNQTLKASGTAPITWKVTAGSLPNGLALSAGGVISGTSSAVGKFDFTVRAENNAGNATKEFSIIIYKLAPDITTNNLPFGVVGKAYSQSLSATGITPITWEVKSGTLPDGLSLSEDGVISGTPTANGLFEFTVKAENTAGEREQTLSIHISLIDMVWINPGKFTMGSPTSEPGHNYNGRDETQHQVTLTKGFFIGIYQVTQEQYTAVIGSNPSYFKIYSLRFAAVGESGVKRPVEQVSWYDALVFCNRLSIKEGLTPAYSINGSTNPDSWGAVPTSNNATWNAVIVVAGSTGYRLPTEAQWEYACRAGTTTAFNNGNNDPTNSTLVGQVAWYMNNSQTSMSYGRGTHEVGLKKPNAWGLYDMHGNVWEWCWDWYGTYPTSAQPDPAGASSGSIRVAHGGSWSYNAQYTRSAYRYYYGNPNVLSIDLGFRLVRP